MEHGNRASDSLTFDIPSEDAATVRLATKNQAADTSATRYVEAGRLVVEEPVSDSSNHIETMAKEPSTETTINIDTIHIKAFGMAFRISGQEESSKTGIDSAMTVESSRLDTSPTYDTPKTVEGASKFEESDTSRTEQDDANRKLQSPNHPEEADYEETGEVSRADSQQDGGQGDNTLPEEELGHEDRIAEAMNPISLSDNMFYTGDTNPNTPTSATIDKTLGSFQEGSASLKFPSNSNPSPGTKSHLAGSTGKKNINTPKLTKERQSAQGRFGNVKGSDSSSVFALRPDESFKLAGDASSFVRRSRAKQTRDQRLRKNFRA